MVKPTSDITWATGGGALKTDPGSTKKAAGYLDNEKPAADHWNWLFNAIGDWIAWLSGNSQAGISKWEAGISYDQNDIVKATGGYGIYVSLANSNLNNALPSDIVSDSNWQYIGPYIENCTADPSSPSTGRMWLRTDL